jgi:hypothetical protein
VEDTATEKTNWERAEKFKNALNLGWVHAYVDGFGERGGSLLADECKFLSEKNGKVIKQETGPVTTKDLYDAASVVTTDLLHEALERWSGGHLSARAYGSTDNRVLQSNTPLVDRMLQASGEKTYVSGHHGKGPAWEALHTYQADRARGRGQGGGGYQPSRLRSIQDRQQRNPFGTRERRY